MSERPQATPKPGLAVEAPVPVPTEPEAEAIVARDLPGEVLGFGSLWASYRRPIEAAR